MENKKSSNPFEVEEPIENEQVQALEKALELGESFSALLLEIDPQKLQVVIQKLKTDLPNLKMREITLPIEIDNLYRYLAKTKEEKNDVLILNNFAEVCDHNINQEAEKFIANLNMTRDHFNVNFHSKIIFVVDSQTTTKLFNSAPDFFSAMKIYYIN